MKAPEKITASLTPEMAQAIRESVAAGEYASTDEALRDAVRHWHRQRVEDSERLAAIRARIRRSLDDPRPDLDEDDVEAHFEQLHSKAMKSRAAPQA